MQIYPKKSHANGPDNRPRTASCGDAPQDAPPSVVDYGSSRLPLGRRGDGAVAFAPGIAACGIGVSGVNRRRAIPPSLDKEVPPRWDNFS